MALDEFDHAMTEVKMDAYLEKIRPPVNIRPELDLGYKIDNQSVILFEIRPNFKTQEPMEMGFAKTTYSKTDHFWKIYWHRADGKWHRYEPVPNVNRIEDFMDVVDEDKYACFMG